MEACVRYPTLHSQLSQSSKRWPGSRIQPGKPTSEEHHVFMVKLGPDHPLRNPTGMSKSPFPGNVLKATVAIFCAPYPYIYKEMGTTPFPQIFAPRDLPEGPSQSTLNHFREREHAYTPWHACVAVHTRRIGHLTGSGPRPGRPTLYLFAVIMPPFSL